MLAFLPNLPRGNERVPQPIERYQRVIMALAVRAARTMEGMIYARASPADPAALYHSVGFIKTGGDQLGPSHTSPQRVALAI